MGDDDDVRLGWVLSDDGGMVPAAVAAGASIYLVCVCVCLGLGLGL